MSGANSKIDKKGSKLVGRTLDNDHGDPETFARSKREEEDGSPQDISEVNQTMTVWKRSDTDFGTTEPDECENEYKNRQSIVLKGPT